MSKRKFCLMGYRGSGKSSTWRLLHDIVQNEQRWQPLALRFLSLDSEVEKVAGGSISEIVKNDGWEQFRDLETLCLEKITQENERLCLDLGGGVVLRERNRKLLKAHYFVFWLDLPEEVLVQNQLEIPRPSFTAKAEVEDIFKLKSRIEKETRDNLTFRLALYKECANLRLDGEIEKNTYQILLEMEKQLFD